MFHQDIQKIAKENNNFRKVVSTGKNAQLVVMNIPPSGEIGEETHPSTDQILFLVEGEGEAEIDGQVTPFKAHQAVFVPAGTLHNFRNTGKSDLKLYTVYAPPAHKDGTIHQTREDAIKDEGYS